MSSLLGSLLGGLLATSDASAIAMQACAAIYAIGVNLQMPGSDSYSYAANHCWSAANADDVPACVAFPQNTEDVSQIVTVLQNYTDVNFAMKSGGHNPNRGFSSVDGGVLISFSNLASTTYNPESQTADLGPGGRWVEVAQALDPYGVTVVGGRIGDVGVGGFLLGGGLSFFSAQYGLACDNIVSYEIVLSNATIVNANATSHTDLFWALHGGGNQFGIVTKFTLKTYKIGQVWGGFRIYSGDQSSALLDATHDFITNYDDPKAAVIVTGEITIDTAVEIWVVFFFYNGEIAPPGVFDQFNAIAPITDNTKTQSYLSMISADNDFNVYGFRYLIRGTTLPNLPAPQGSDLYNQHYNDWKQIVTGGSPLELLLQLRLLGLLDGLLSVAHIFSIAFQPMPYAIPAASQRINPNGNVLGLDPKFGDQIWMEYDISWLTAGSDTEAYSTAIQITQSIDAYAQSTYNGVKNTHYEAGNVMTEEYNPTFLNDAMYDQNPLGSYGQATYERLKVIQQAYDPVGLFPGRTGGFKFT